MIVPFDPILEADKTTAFHTAHNVSGPIEIRGPYSGKLHDDGEQVQLQYPDEPPAEDPDFYPGLLADDEFVAMRHRATKLVTERVLPADEHGHRYPWPLV